MTSKTDVLRLYKQLLTTAKKFDNYNFREYSKRKIVDSFKEHKTVDENQVTKFYNNGIDELSRLIRQTAVSRMYTFDKLVIEPLKKHHH